MTKAGLSVRVNMAAKILHRIAHRGPLNKYKILNMGKLGSPNTFYNLMIDLEKIGFFKVHSTRKNARGGKPSDDYDITPDGLIFLLSAASNASEHLALDLEKLARKYSSKQEFLYRVFTSWHDLETFKIADLATDRLLHLASRCMPNLEDMLSKSSIRDLEDRLSRLGVINGNLRNDAPMSYAARFVDAYFFNVAEITAMANSESDRERWMEALRRSPKLGSKAEEGLKLHMEQAEEVARTAKFYLEFLKGTQRWSSTEIASSRKKQRNNLLARYSLV